MSERYPGGIISKNAPTVTGGTTGSGSAPGVWTLDQQATYAQAGTWPLAGNYIEDVFSTYLYTGNGSTQTFNNGVNLSDKGGMVWIKQRSSPAEDWRCVDSARGINYGLQQNLTNAQQDWTGLGYVTSFNTNGFSIGTNVSINTSAYTYASWTFRKQPKFFDVVTYTGNGAAPRNIAHNLGSTPGCILIKCTNTTGDWFVWHRSMTSTTSNYLVLNSTAAQASGFYWPNGVTDTFFSVNGTLGNINTNGNTYVAYLFAHDAGGFGLTGTDNVISCGTFTTDGSENSTTNLGYEPQWLLLKATAGATAGSQPWHIFDNMRGLTVAGRDDASLQPNNSNAESQVNRIGITSTGFTTNAFGANTTFIYIAIRRGPMKTPTTGTSVFVPVARTGNGTGGNPSAVTTGIVTDLAMVANRTSNVSKFNTVARLTNNLFLRTSGTNAEAGSLPAFPTSTFDLQNGFYVGNDSDSATLTNGNGLTYINYAFQRAPGFFDVVCDTGTGAAHTITHGLTVSPELLIRKQRSGGNNWCVYTSALGNTKVLNLESTGSPYTDVNAWNSTSPTSSVFSVGTSGETNTSGGTFVTYLFASCPGVSKVGSYTGTGATQTISCGFAGGARFVLIKRTDSTGDWYVWDTARGMVSGTDPSLLLNSTAAEVNANSIYTTTGGFQIVSTAAGINASGGTYIYLAIA